jgi:hypothetical protein
MSTEIEKSEDIDEQNEYQDHLNNLEDGSGCTEIWEHITEYREE